MIAAGIIVLCWTNLIALVVGWRLYARVCEYEQRIGQLHRHATRELERQRLRAVNGTSR